MGLFKFDTFDVSIDSVHRAFIVTLNSTEITFEFLNDWEHFLDWLSAHSEVNAIYVRPKSNLFLQGLKNDEISSYSPKELQKFFIRIQKITLAHLHLPQTLIFDLAEGACGIGVEFSLGADIRVARAGCKVKFNHLESAMIPSCGGVALLSTLTSHSFAKNWVTSCSSLDHMDLKSAGFILDYYTSNNNEIMDSLLEKFSLLAPVARIQLKCSFLENILPDIDKLFEREIRFSHATLSVNDWKKAISNKTKDEFCSAKQLKDLLKRAPEIQS